MPGGASAVAVKVLSPSLFVEAYHDLAIPIDLRAAHEMALSHVPGAIGLPLKDLAHRFAAVAKGVLPENAPLLLVGSTPRAAQVAQDRLADEGFSVLGCLEGGMDLWLREHRSTSAFPRRALPHAHPPFALVATAPTYPWEKAHGDERAAPSQVLVQRASMTATLASWLRERGYTLSSRRQGAALWHVP